MATYAVGDIQGCFATLEALLHRIDFHPARDRLWLAGDLVNRGPRSVDVLRWARDLGDAVVAVLGNHDLHLLSCAMGARGLRPNDTFGDVLSAPDREQLISWLRSRPLLHREGANCMVHAGLLPQWSIEDAQALAAQIETELRGDRASELLARVPADEPRSADDPPQDPIAYALTVFTNLRCVDSGGAMRRSFKGPPKDAPPGLLPWFDHPRRRSRDVRVVCGHWAALGLHLTQDVAALDTGCVWGRALTALRLEDNAVFQVSHDST